ncbi:MAG: hypothetical protein OXH13_01180 [Chloroflexi bacterium]|nr:hypothetical protein [Chloroflexota bacterium]MCY3697245.1 hypothetical protein [Chloroflexota bacterium]MXX31665.1 hypothetical protein [Chloroflexota bacterium]MXX81841.1 hypothetical protein [Chloroflexota bacterium]MYB21159.1 hypothetical protein [Chloroflexota bacterium]
MSGQNQPLAGSDSQEPERAATPDPLWMPRGSVRALIAIGVVAVWASLETGLVGVPPSDAVRSIAVAVAAGYGVLRSRDQRSDRSDRTGGRE